MYLNVPFLLAGICALSTFVLHVVVGGRLFAAPLHASDSLRPIVRLTLYFCWHFVTISVAALAAAYFFVATTPGYAVLAVGATAVSAAFSLLGIGIVMANRVRPFLMPQWLLFGLIALLGAGGLLTDS